MGVGGGNGGRLSIGIIGWGRIEGVSRALPCIWYRCIIGGGKEASRG